MFRTEDGACKVVGVVGMIRPRWDQVREELLGCSAYGELFLLLVVYVPLFLPLYITLVIAFGLMGDPNL